MISASRRHHRPALITTYSNTYSPRCKSHKQHQPYRRYKEHCRNTQLRHQRRPGTANQPHEPSHYCRQRRCTTSHHTAHLHRQLRRISRTITAHRNISERHPDDFVLFLLQSDPEHRHGLHSPLLRAIRRPAADSLPLESKQIYRQTCSTCVREILLEAPISVRAE